MTIRVAINGFGRIGRLVFQAGFRDPELEFVAINDLTDAKTLAHLLKYDSVHRRFPGEVWASGNNLVVNGKQIPIYAEKDPSLLPWGKLNVDVVVESTGFFLTRELASKHLAAGAKRVLLSADAKEESIKTLVRGVNEHEFDKAKDTVVSNASCTTNCTAPMVKVLNDNFGIERAFFSTVHAYTATQKLHDAPDKNLRNARAAAQNIIPHPSGAAKAVVQTIPALKGKFDGMALRVPVIDGSFVSVFAVVKKQTSKDDVNALFKNVSQFHLKGVLEYAEDPIVSTDIIGNPHSCIFEPEFTKVNENLVQVNGWYDNEWGYSCRMVDMVKLIGR